MTNKLLVDMHMSTILFTFGLVTITQPGWSNIFVFATLFAGNLARMEVEGARNL